MMMTKSLDSRRQRDLFDIGEHHIHACFRKGLTERQPDAACATRYKYRLPNKVLHVLTLQMQP